jgi:hypothetical protein
VPWAVNPTRLVSRASETNASGRALEDAAVRIKTLQLCADLVSNFQEQLDFQNFSKQESSWPVQTLLPRSEADAANLQTELVWRSEITFPGLHRSSS